MIAPALQARISAQLRIDEGYRPKPYVDTVGKVSIGIGRNLTDKGLRPDEIQLLFMNDLYEAYQGACTAMGGEVAFLALTLNRQSVILNMSFNMGLTKLLTFTNTLLAVKEARYDDAAQHMLQSKWAAQVGARAQYLAHLMESG